MKPLRLTLTVLILVVPLSAQQESGVSLTIRTFDRSICSRRLSFGKLWVDLLVRFDVLARVMSQHVLPSSRT